MKNTKKIIGALAICGILAAGGTLAYLSNVTDTKHNVFTIGSGIKGDILEPNWPGNGGQDVEYAPSSTILKDPQIINNSDAESAYIGIKLEYKVNETDAWAKYLANNNGTTFTSIQDVYASVGATNMEEYVKEIAVLSLNKNNTNGKWLPLAGTQNGYYYATLDGSAAQPLPAHSTSDPLFRDVTIKSSISIDKMIPFEISATGYLVQSKDVSSATGITELAGLMNR